MADILTCKSADIPEGDVCFVQASAIEVGAIHHGASARRLFKIEPTLSKPKLTRRRPA